MGHPLPNQTSSLPPGSKTLPERFRTVSRLPSVPGLGEVTYTPVTTGFVDPDGSHCPRRTTTPLSKSTSVGVVRPAIPYQVLGT